MLYAKLKDPYFQRIEPRLYAVSMQSPEIQILLNSENIKTEVDDERASSWSVCEDKPTDEERKFSLLDSLQAPRVPILLATT